MTFSIVATDGTAWGVAVASRFLAVGSVVPAARAGVGAVATQSLANLRYRSDGLRLLAAGRDALATLDALTAADERRDDRQAGVVDAHGGAATFTGDRCDPWAGGVSGPSYAVQGNILAGPQVVAQMSRTWEAGDRGQPLADRLLGALLAGDRAGGDRRGRQSAALLVVAEGAGYGGGDDVLVDLRVDDHPDPVPELGRLLELHSRYFGAPDPGTAMPLTGDTAAEVRRHLDRIGYDDADLDRALRAWIEVENLERRQLPGRIDATVLAVLREAAG